MGDLKEEGARTRSGEEKSLIRIQINWLNGLKLLNYSVIDSSDFQCI